MSLGAGLVRTTCSSGGAPGPGASAGQPSEGLLDPVYPRTQGALLKVAQMELLHYLIGTLLLLIASIVAASKSYNQSGLVAGAVFGFLATFLCLASVWLSYKISCVTQSTDAAV